MARERIRHVSDITPLIAPSVVMPHDTPDKSANASKLTPLTLVKSTARKKPLTSKAARIRSCLRTVATLLETDHKFLPIFLRLERELQAELLMDEAVRRSRLYL